MPSLKGARKRLTRLAEGIGRRLRFRGQRLAVAAANRLGGQMYLQYKPDLAARHGQIAELPELMAIWTGRQPMPHGGDQARLFLLYYQIKAAAALPGAFAEVGVYKGVTARLLRHMAPGRMLYLFDTFQGFAATDVAAERQASGLSVREGHFSDTSLDAVRAFVGSDAHTVYCPGLFPDTAAHVPDGERFALAHFDADLYQPAVAFCEFFYPRMVPGGVMIFHDYNGGYAGVRQAVDAFFADKPEGVVAMPDKSGSAVVVRLRERP
jgi:O-methyltransferase